MNPIITISNTHRNRGSIKCKMIIVMSENHKIYLKRLYASYLSFAYPILRKITLKAHVSGIGNAHVWSQNGGSISNIVS